MKRWAAPLITAFVAGILARGLVLRESSPAPRAPDEGGHVGPSHREDLGDLARRLDGHFSTSYLWLNSVLIGLVLSSVTTGATRLVALFQAHAYAAAAAAALMLIVVLLEVLLVYAEVVFGSVLIGRTTALAEILVPAAVGLTQFSQVAVLALPVRTEYQQAGWVLGFTTFALLGNRQVTLVLTGMRERLLPVAAAEAEREYKANLQGQVKETARAALASFAMCVGVVGASVWFTPRVTSLVSLACALLLGILLVNRIARNARSRTSIVAELRGLTA